MGPIQEAAVVAVMTWFTQGQTLLAAPTISHLDHLDIGYNVVRSSVVTGQAHEV
jgi:hypothetical protein